MVRKPRGRATTSDRRLELLICILEYRLVLHSDTKLTELTFPKYLCHECIQHLSRHMLAVAPS